MRICLWVLIAMLCASCSPNPEQKPVEPPQKAPVAAKQDPMDEQLVRLDIPLGSASDAKKLFDEYSKLEDELDAAAKKAGVGSLDGNEIGGGSYAIYLYGRDSTKLADVVKSTLKGRALPKGCKLVLRHGGVNDKTAKEETIAVDN